MTMLSLIKIIVKKEVYCKFYKRNDPAGRSAGSLLILTRLSASDPSKYLRDRRARETYG